MDNPTTSSEPEYAAPSPVLATCAYCHAKPRKPGRGKVISLYCSDRCRAAARNERHREVYRRAVAECEELKRRLDALVKLVGSLLPRGERP